MFIVNRSPAPVAALAIIAATTSYAADVIGPDGHGAAIRIGGTIPAYLALDLIKDPIPITPSHINRVYCASLTFRANTPWSLTARLTNASAEARWLVRCGPASVWQQFAAGAEQPLKFEPEHFAGRHSLRVYYMPDDRCDFAAGLDITLRPLSGTSTASSVHLPYLPSDQTSAATLRPMYPTLSKQSEDNRWHRGPYVEVTEG